MSIEFRHILILDIFSQSNKFWKKSKRKFRVIQPMQMSPHCPYVFWKSSGGCPENILRTSWGRLKSISQGQPLDVRLGCPLDLILRRPQGVRSRRPWNSKIRSLGDLLGTLDEEVHETSWEPTFTGWVNLLQKMLIFDDYS